MSGPLRAMIECALAYARRGWHVLPLHWPLLGVGGAVTGCSCGGTNEKCSVERTNWGKHPRTGAGGFKHATNNADQIRAWWTAWPDANIGLWPGPSGFVVIDVDGPVGKQSARALGILDLPTLRARTGRADGGDHLYFIRPDFPIGNRRLGIAWRGLDVRCDAGYVVAPPSSHQSGGTYRWATRGVAPAVLPAHVIELLRAPPEPPAAAVPAFAWPATDDTALERRIAAYVDKLPVGLKNGDHRNEHAWGLAAWLTHDMALNVSQAEPWLRTWNARQAEPLTERELLTTLKNGDQFGGRPRGSGRDRPRSHGPFVRPIRPSSWARPCGDAQPSPRARPCTHAARRSAAS